MTQTADAMCVDAAEIEFLHFLHSSIRTVVYPYEIRVALPAAEAGALLVAVGCVRLIFRHSLTSSNTLRLEIGPDASIFDFDP